MAMAREQSGAVDERQNTVEGTREVLTVEEGQSKHLLPNSTLRK